MKERSISDWAFSCPRFWGVTSEAHETPKINKREMGSKLTKKNTSKVYKTVQSRLHTAPTSGIPHPIVRLFIQEEWARLLVIRILG